MANVNVMSVENKKAGSIDLDPAVFETSVKPHLFQAEVRRQLALRHGGTHSSKNRAATSGGNGSPHFIASFVEEFGLDGFKTRRIAEILGALGVAGESVLIVLGQEDVHVEKSAKNIRGVGVVRAAGLNVYDLLRHKKIVVTRSAVERIEARLGSSGSASEDSE